MSKLNITKDNRHIPMPTTHKREPASKAPQDGGFAVIDADHKVWASGLSRKDAQRRANALSASQECRTTKVVAMSELGTFESTTKLVVPTASVVKMPPPISIMAGAQAAAAQAAEEANARAKAKAAERERLAQLEKQAKETLSAVDDDGVNVDDLLGGDAEPSEAELAAAEIDDAPAI